jgi:hypothetical protein
VKTPSLGDSIFAPTGYGYRDEFKLLLDLYDETWVLEHISKDMGGYALTDTDTTALVRVNKYSD